MASLLERSMQGLVTTTRNSFNTKLRHNVVHTVNLSNVTYTQVDDDKLKLECIATTGDQQYRPQIILKGIEVVESGTPGSLDILHTKNIMPLSRNSECEYTCNCLDYRWTFAYYNDVAGNLLGDPPPPYQARPGAAPRNPSRTPGLCKHLLKVIELLEQEGVVK